MVRTRCAFILNFRMVAHKAAFHTLSKGFILINEDLTQILLVLKSPIEQDLEVLLPAMNQVCSLAISLQQRI